MSLFTQTLPYLDETRFKLVGLVFEDHICRLHLNNLSRDHLVHEKKKEFTSVLGKRDRNTIAQAVWLSYMTGRSASM